MNSPLLAAPLRSEAFAEDFADDYERPQPGSSVEPPWTLRQALLAALLCAVPVAVATLGTLVNFVATGA
jgi:hypothetical protein